MIRLIPSIIALLLASLSVQAKERISILDFMVSPSAKKAVGSDASQYLTQKTRDVATSLIDASRFEVMTREGILVMLPAGKKSLAECEGQCEVETARNIGSRWHVVGDIKKPGSGLALSIRLYDVAGGGQIGGVTVEGKSVDELAGNVGFKSRELFAKIPGLNPVTPSPELGADAPHPDLVPTAGVSKLIVSFSSQPAGAAVTVDGKFLCQTPNGKAVLQGEHWIEMGKDGYRSKREKVMVSRNGQELSWNLTPIQTRLSLEAVDDRTGGDLVADVYVDGARVGQTPFNDLVAVGAQRIEVAPSGFERQTVSVALEEGKTVIAVAHFRSVVESKVPKRAVSVFEGSSGAFTDVRDGAIYRWVKIDDRIWMAENLKFKAGSASCYDGKESNCERYGQLYDWASAADACPTGWRIPSNRDWKTLVSDAGGDGERLYGSETRIASQRLRSKDGWAQGRNGLDAYGLSLQPAGYGHETACILFFFACRSYSGMGSNAGFWSESDRLNHWSFYLYEGKDGILNSNVDRDTYHKYSVRCVKDR